ncbi:hypothetical protein [Streptomyces chilikensis]|uniref:Lipoprotein n=1 Tax=Streptomyces chilikensis TaxID=1194079 RepID=A0ABV3EZT2_9ACTN
MPYRKRGRAPALLAATGLLLAACGSVEASQPDGPARSPGQARPSPESSRPPGERVGGKATPAERVESVRLTVTGGIAGVHRSILASTDGTVEVSERSKGDWEADPLSGADRDRLKALLEKIDFAALPPRSVDEDARDMFVYALEHDGRAVVTDRSVSLGAADDLIGQLERHLEERL